VTTTPNDALRDLHDRMPVVVEEDAWDRWLGSEPADPGELLGLLVPDERVALEIYPVVRDVNDVRRDGPGLIEPLPTPTGQTPPPGLFDASVADR